MSVEIIYRGYTFTGAISLKFTDGTQPQNVFPYVIPALSTVEIHLPENDDTDELPVPVPVVLSSSVALPSPYTSNEVIITNASQGQATFTCTPQKASLMGVGTNLAVDVLVIKSQETITLNNFPLTASLGSGSSSDLINVQFITNATYAVLSVSSDGNTIQFGVPFGDVSFVSQTAFVTGLPGFSAGQAPVGNLLISVPVAPSAIPMAAVPVTFLPRPNNIDFFQRNKIITVDDPANL